MVRASVVALALLLAASAAHADLVPIAVTARLDTLSNDDFGRFAEAGVGLGSIATAIFWIETDTPDTDDDPRRGLYWDAVKGFSIAAGDWSVVVGEGHFTLAAVGVYDWPAGQSTEGNLIGDYLSLNVHLEEPLVPAVGPALFAITLAFQFDPDGTMLGSDALRLDVDLLDGGNLVPGPTLSIAQRRQFSSGDPAPRYYFVVETVDVTIPPADTDDDGVHDSADNCPLVPNVGQDDSDGDLVGEACDNCPGFPNQSQSDSDIDAVGDACDNCVTAANPRLPANFLAASPWAVLTGGQRDDDLDGYGNVCDAKFPGTLGTMVGASDLVEFRASNGKNRAGTACGSGGFLPCAIFDLDGTGTLIGAGDLARFRLLNGKVPGPKCSACPLTCEAGASRTCEP